MSVPGQRSAQPAYRAAMAVQRTIGRAVAETGGLSGEFAVTGRDGRRRVLAVGEDGREMWTDQETGVTWCALDDEGV